MEGLDDGNEQSKSDGLRNSSAACGIPTLSTLPRSWIEIEKVYRKESLTKLSRTKTDIRPSASGRSRGY